MSSGQPRQLSWRALVRSLSLVGACSGRRKRRLTLPEEFLVSLLLGPDGVDNFLSLSAKLAVAFQDQVSSFLTHPGAAGVESHERGNLVIQDLEFMQRTGA